MMMIKKDVLRQHLSALSLTDFKSFSFTSPEGETISCHSLLRLIPGRRAVFKAEKNGQTVIVKIFFHPKKAHFHYQRELKGYLKFQEAIMPIPKLLAQLEIEPQYCYALMMEYVAEGRTLPEVLSTLDTEKKNQTIKQLLLLIAQQHQHGILHYDLHLNNFLFKHQIICLDFSDIKAQNYPISFAESWQNLALLYAQMTEELKSLFEENLKYYFDTRKTSSIPAGRLQRFSEYLQQKILKKYLKKMCRNSTHAVCEKKWRYHFVAQRSLYDTELKKLLINIEELFVSPTTEFIKCGNSCTVIRIIHQQQAFIIKRHNLRTLTHILLRSIIGSRAVHQWRMAHMLKFFGIATAAPIAYVERRIGPLCLANYYISQQLQGSHADNYFSAVENSQEYVVETMVEKIVLLLKKLASQRICHGDCKAVNIYIENDIPYLIDLDSMRYFTSTNQFRYVQNKDAKRLVRSLEKQPRIYALFKSLLSRAGFDIN